jgi:putative peptidoglycan lipid II flippase
MSEDTQTPINDPQIPVDDAINHAAPLTPKRLLRSLITVMIGFAATKLVSLGQVIIIADRFGASAEYDTFAAGGRVPEQLIKILGVGALSVAFIPVFSGLLNRKEGDEAWRLASQVFNTMLVVALLVSVVIFFSANWLVETIIAPGFDVGQVEQTATIIRILLLSVIIFTLSSLFTGVLNGHNHFLLPVLAPIFYDFGLLFGVIVFTGPWGVYGLAWGTVLGATLHFLIQLPGLLMFKARWFPSLGWGIRRQENKGFRFSGDPQLRTVIKLMIPRMIASGVFAVNFAAYTNIASRLDDGAVSAFDWGLRIMDIPQALIGTAFGFVIFPSLAALTELGRVDERRQMFSEALRFILVATIPAAAGMIVLGKPAVSILFTDSREASLVYVAVQVLAFALILQSVHEIVARAFYAQKDTVLPLIASAIAMFANIALIVLLFILYENVEFLELIGVFGVGLPAIGYGVAFLIELAILTPILHRRWGDIDEQRILQTVWRVLAATIVMALVVLIVDYLLSNSVFTGGGRFPAILRTGVGGVIGLVVFTFVAVLVNLHEIKQLPRLFRRRRKEVLTTGD